MRAVKGLRILLTRSPRGCREWADELRGRGAVPVSFPCIQTQPVDHPEVARQLRQALQAPAHWLVVNSVTGVEAVDRLLPSGVPEAVAIGAVGPRTAAAARQLLGRVDLVSRRGTGSSLATDLLRRLRGTGETAARVVVAAAADGRRDLEAVLEPVAIEVTRVPVYRTLPAVPVVPRRSFGDAIDVVFLASPSAVVGLRAQADVETRIPIVTIGPTTSAAVRTAGLQIAAEAERRSLEAMVEVIP